MSETPQRPLPELGALLAPAGTGIGGRVKPVSVGTGIGRVMGAGKVAVLITVVVVGTGTRGARSATLPGGWLKVPEVGGREEAFCCLIVHRAREAPGVPRRRAPVLGG